MGHQRNNPKFKTAQSGSVGLSLLPRIHLNKQPGSGIGHLQSRLCGGENRWAPGALCSLHGEFQASERVLPRMGVIGRRGQCLRNNSRATLLWPPWFCLHSKKKSSKEGEGYKEHPTQLCWLDTWRTLCDVFLWYSNHIYNSWNSRKIHKGRK